MDKELEKAANNWVTQPVIGTKRESFIAGAKWQAERMYSEEDMKKAYEHGMWALVDGNGHGDTFEEWFEQFKKK